MPWDKAQRKRKNKIVKVKVMILVMVIQVMDLYPSLIMKWIILVLKPKKLIFQENTSQMMMQISTNLNK